jgi:hypothetical protein
MKIVAIREKENTKNPVFVDYNDTDAESRSDSESETLQKRKKLYCLINLLVRRATATHLSYVKMTLSLNKKEVPLLRNATNNE